MALDKTNQVALPEKKITKICAITTQCPWHGTVPERPALPVSAVHGQDYKRDVDGHEKKYGYCIQPEG